MGEDNEGPLFTPRPGPNRASMDRQSMDRGRLAHGRAAAAHAVFPDDGDEGDAAEGGRGAPPGSLRHRHVGPAGLAAGRGGMASPRGTHSRRAIVPVDDDML